MTTASHAVAMAWSATLFLAAASPAAAQRPEGPAAKHFAPPTVRIAGGDAMVRLVGRWEVPANEGPATGAWSGCRVEFEVRDAVAVDVLFQGRAGVRFDAWVDGKPAGTVVALENGRERYHIAEGLDPSRPHRFELRKRTEPLFGEVRFLGLELPGGGALAALPPAPARRVEFIGDSITCGYGVEAAGEREHFTPETENFNATYAALVADELRAEPHAVAWTGACLSAKIAEQLGWAKCLPSIYPLTLPERSGTRWDFARWTPDVVVINLGTNDFSANPPPEPAAWSAEYVDFLAVVRGHYPHALIVCASGPMLDPTPLNALRAAIRTAVKTRRAAGDTQLQAVEFPAQDAGRDGLGADYHPSRATHRRMAAQLVGVIRSGANWP